MRKGKPVLCVETGRVFDCAKEASAWAGVGGGAMHQVLNGYSKTAGGYHWRYVGAQDETIVPKQHKPKSRPSMTIEEVQAEAERRTRETGRYTRYAHIQIEETLALARNQATVHKPKRRTKI